MEPCYVKFSIASQEQLERLGRIVSAFARDKQADEFRSDEEWKKFFSEEELGSFWAPSTPEEHFSEPTSKVPWDFGSMLDSIRNGEYSLLGVRSDDMKTGYLEFDPHAYPFGGVGCLLALVLAFGHQLIGCDDGTGFVETSEA